MPGQTGSLGYWLGNPDAILYTVATALLYPILYALVLALGYLLYETGRFCFEIFGQYRKRDFPAMEAAALQARDEARSGKLPDALRRLALVKGGFFFQRFFSRLAASNDLSKLRVMKRLNDLELAITKRLERTRLLVRVGPVLGLMGSLIPIGPALVALSNGDVKSLTTNLVVAFAMSVIGMLIGGLAYLISTVRDRRYTQDVSDIEYVLETLES
jgi:biopolymer transport protein ExbB/TolQ